MEPNQKLPFKAGQLAESKSWQSGFRGAWFRCKIKNILKKKGHINYSLEFYDFPDEKVGNTKLYQMPQLGVSREEKKFHLMVRPSFPPIYSESQMPDICTISEVIAIVDDIWKVGDLVDWWTDGCYWSGIITDLLGEENVKIKLQDPPFGEGQSYEVSCKDLRPSLDWSPEGGWTVPISAGCEACRSCVRLVPPVKQASGIDIGPSRGASSESSATSFSSHGAESAKLSRATRLSSLGSAGTSYPGASFSPVKGPEKQLSASMMNEEAQFLDSKELPKQLSGNGLDEEKVKPCSIKGLDLGDVGVRVASPLDSVSSIHVQHVSATREKQTSVEGGPNYNESSEKMQVTGPNVLSSLYSDTVESSISDLEELANKIKWLKRAHQYGFQHANLMAPSWKFLEDGASFIQR